MNQREKDELAYAARGNPVKYPHEIFADGAAYARKAVFDKLCEIGEVLACERLIELLAEPEAP